MRIKFIQVSLYTMQILILWVVGFSFSRALAQSADQYIFSSTLGTYSQINGTNISSIQTHQAVSGSVPIGFPFVFAGISYHYLKASSDGWVTFDTSYSGSNQVNNNSTSLFNVTPSLFPFWNVPLNGINGTASYITTGIAPNRVFTLEWRDWSVFYGGSWNIFSGNAPSISFQLELHESTNIINFNYHRESGLMNSSASIGISDNSNFLSLTNSLALPIAISYDLVNTIDSRPVSGQIYTFSPPTSCNGSPLAGHIAVPDTLNLCASGASFPLIDTGYSNASLLFQWQSSTNGGNVWNDIVGANSYCYQSTTNVNTQYRVKVTCATSNQSSFTPVVVVNIGAPQAYNTLPYFQDFEEWFSYCGNSDVPGVGWTNNPSIGDNSWRRDDEGIFADWTTPQSGFYYPLNSHSARFHSTKALIDFPGNLDLHINCSSSAPYKGLYFNFLNHRNSQITGQEDSLRVFLSLNGGLTFTNIAILDTGNWEKVYIPFSSNSATTVLRFQGITGAAPIDQTTDLGIDSVYIADPCNGQPVAGLLSSISPLTGCPGSSFSLYCTGATQAGDVTYQWQYSSNGGASWFNMNVGNSTFFNLILHTPALYDTTAFRLKITCNNSGLSSFSNIVTIDIQTPNGDYASLPFIETFENWISQCDSNDVPGSGNNTPWVNFPAYNQPDLHVPSPTLSWRRSDQEIFPLSSTIYFPKSVDGNYSAKNGASIIPCSNLDVLINCATSGSKELQFYLNYQISCTGCNIGIYDSFKVFISTDAGVTFNSLKNYGMTNGWEHKIIPITTDSAKTIIRFSPQQYGQGNVKGAGLDLVKILLPCSGMPVAGIVDSIVAPCPNKDFFLNVSGGTESSGLTYRWQKSLNGANWTTLSSDTFSSAIMTNISSNTWFRCIVKCLASSLADTTSPKYIELAPFYYCYCDDQTQNSYGVDGNIGSFRLADSLTQNTMIYTGDSLQLYDSVGYNMVNYSNYNYLSPALLYRNTSNYVKITEIIKANPYPNFVMGKLVLYIDYNRDGMYDPLSELAFSTDFANHPDQSDSGYFAVPVSSQIGITGMRVMLDYFEIWGTPYPLPCATFSGEVEDYLVNINYAFCSGPLNAGNSNISDTLVFSGTSISLSNSTHDSPGTLQASQILWVWQSSVDSLNWINIPGSETHDTAQQIVTTKTWFRLMTICKNSHDTTYSNIVYANVETTGISSVPGSQDLQLYPNPTTGKLNLKYSGNSRSYLVLIVSDVTGKQLIRKDFENIFRGFSADLDISAYPKGVYIIQAEVDHQQFNNRIILK